MHPLFCLLIRWDSLDSAKCGKSVSEALDLLLFKSQFSQPLLEDPSKAEDDAHAGPLESLFLIGLEDLYLQNSIKPLQAPH